MAFCVHEILSYLSLPFSSSCLLTTFHGPGRGGGGRLSIISIFSWDVPFSFIESNVMHIVMDYASRGDLQTAINERVSALRSCRSRRRAEGSVSVSE